MAVKVGSARLDEHGNIGGGQAGDQTGKEVSTQDWYLHEYGWRVFRAKDPAKAEKIAQDMQYACDNNNIGYDQWQNTTLYEAAKPYDFNCSKVKVPCETDCSRLVRICVLYAGIQVREFNTATEPEALLATGQFEELTGTKYTNSSDYLKRGDILDTRRQGHTVVVLSNGSKAVEVAPVKPAEPEQKKIADAYYYDKAMTGKYKIVTDLYLRTAANPKDPNNILYVMKEGKTVQCWGYYNIYNGVKWPCVVYGNMKGYCSSKYLKKV